MKPPLVAGQAARDAERLRIKMKITKEIAHLASEKDVRNLRDAIYGQCTENNWEHCREKWMRRDSVEWLIEHQPQ